MKLAFLALLFFFQQGGSPPDDPNPEWEGQKLWCNNYHDNGHKCACALATSCDAHRDKNPNLFGNGMGSKCQTYCKRDHCHCLSPCTS